VSQEIRCASHGCGYETEDADAFHAHITEHVSTSTFMWSCACGTFGNGLGEPPLHNTPAGAVCRASIPRNYKVCEEIMEHRTRADGTRWLARMVVCR
jgi:hypothetical protein